MAQVTIRPPKKLWLLGWIAPHKLQDNDAQRASDDISKLCSAFRELDSHFIAAMRRGCDLKSLDIRGGSYDHWKLAIGFDESDLADFISLDRAAMSNLQYLQDQQRMAFWKLAMSFLEQEQEGFPGRMIINDGGKGYKQMPKPRRCRSSWATHIDQIERVAARLPRYLLETAENGNLADRSLFEGVHERMIKLDAFLDRTYEGGKILGPRLSFAEHIDRSWPPGIQQLEPFTSLSLNSRVATAYPRNLKLSTNQVMSIFLIIGSVSIVSAVFIVLSFQQSPKRGSWGDGDFYSLCQGSLLQISGIVILIITVFFRSPRLAKQAWGWAWSLALLSLITALMAVPMYGFVSAGWGTICVALSGILQTWVSVMLMFIVSD